MAVVLLRVILSQFLSVSPPFPSLDVFVNLNRTPQKRAHVPAQSHFFCSVAWQDRLSGGPEKKKNQAMNYPALSNDNGSDGIFLIFALAFLFSRQQ